jgi:ATP-dependent DNA ligase
MIDPPSRQPPKQWDYNLPIDIPPIDARTAEEFPEADGLWQYEPKWDGFRSRAFKSRYKDRVESQIL